MQSSSRTKLSVICIIGISHDSISESVEGPVNDPPPSSLGVVNTLPSIADNKTHRLNHLAMYLGDEYLAIPSGPLTHVIKTVCCMNDNSITQSCSTDRFIIVLPLKLCSFDLQSWV